jgi:Protein kinase domain
VRTRVGPYRIDHVLGRGGMGVVYRGLHERLDRPLAIKALAPELTWQPEFKDRFFAEARTQARLQHPNILAVYDLLEDAGEFFIVMEYVSASPLDAILRDTAGKGMPIPRALEIISEILLALDYAHSQAVIHRDVKPSNVLVTTDGRVKLTDFGIALLVGDKRLTSSRASIGTPIYMSPEQILRPRMMDHRADVYSAAIVLYEMLAGEPPFDAETEYEIKKLQIEAPPPELCERRPEVPRPLSHAIRRALAKDPEERFVSARELWRVLASAGAAELSNPTGATGLPAAPTALLPAAAASTGVANAGAESSGTARPPGRRRVSTVAAITAGMILLIGTAVLLRTSLVGPSRPVVGTATSALIPLPIARRAAAPPASAPAVQGLPVHPGPLPAPSPWLGMPERVLSAQPPTPLRESGLGKDERNRPRREDARGGQSKRGGIATGRDGAAAGEPVAASKRAADDRPSALAAGEDQGTAYVPSAATASAPGYVVQVQDLAIEPANLRPGDTAIVGVHFQVRGPDPHEDITVLLFFGLVAQGRYVLGKRTSFVLLNGGAALGSKPLHSTCRISIPRTLAPGSYAIAVTVADAQDRFRQATSRAFEILP